MATTIRDIAKEAQVSSATVSRVLRGDTRNGFRVPEATRERIVSIANSLNYQANAAALAMTSGRTGLIGVVITEVTNSFLNSILAGIQNYVKHHDLAIVLYTEIQDDTKRSEEKLLRAIRSRQIDGVLLAHYEASEELIKTLQDQKMPFVTLSPNDMPGKAAVHVDDEAGGRLAAEHLLDLGHRHIAVFGERRNYSVTRYKGVEKTMAIAGLMPHNAMWPEEDVPMHEKSTVDDVRAMCTDLLTQKPEITAIFCTEDGFVVGAYKAARELGLRIPQDLSIVGYDNMSWTVHLEPALTTVQQPKEQQGRLCMELLQELMEGGKPREVWMNPEFVVRDSTAIPRVASIDNV